MSSNRFTLIGSGILFVATFSVYAGALWNDFVEFDDNLYVSRNNHTAAGLTPASLQYAWSTIETGNWIPLTWMSFQLDAMLYGVTPAGFHFTNVLLHSANVVLLFTWLLRTTGVRECSFIAALLFGLHPMHVESVAWVSERKDVLSTFWMLVAMHTYERYAIRLNTKWYLLTCMTFSLGLLSKSMLVTLPVLLFVADFWPLQRWKTSKSPSEHRYPQLRGGYLFLEKLPLFGLSLLDGIMTIMSQSHGSAFRQPGSTPLERLINVMHSYAWYLAKTFNPTELTALYPRSANGLPQIEIVAALLILLIVSVYVVIFRTSHKYLLFGWLWYLISFLPVIGLIQVGLQAHADRYTYVPHIGLFIMIVWEVDYWISRFAALRWVCALLVTLVTLVLAWMTVSQVAVWKTTESLWNHTLLIDPNNSYAHGALALTCLESGRVEEGARHFDFIARGSPDKKPAFDLFVGIYRKYRDRPDAQSEFRTELGNYYLSERSIEQARIAFQQAITISPENKLARYQLAMVLGELGRFDEAIVHLDKLIEQDPNEISFPIALGLLFEKMGRIADARDQFVNVLKHNPGSTSVINKLNSLNQRLNAR